MEDVGDVAEDLGDVVDPSPVSTPVRDRLFIRVVPRPRSCKDGLCPVRRKIVGSKEVSRRHPTSLGIRDVTSDSGGDGLGRRRLKWEVSIVIIWGR